MNQQTGGSLALLTDLYELTMAYGYWKQGMSDLEAVFNLYFRENPFHGGFAVAAGLEPLVDFFDNFRFEADDLDYLAQLEGNDGKPLFERTFFDFLSTMRFTCDVDAIPEGTLVFPHEPLVRVRGPIFQAQILESAFLNLINFQTLIATKAARVNIAARGESVLEFGLRRAQGIDGALAASRAAYVGGCAATSNVLAGKRFGIPVAGTHAHSWVMSFDSEIESFEAWAAAMPNNAIFLVDTYDSVSGVRHAIEAGRKLEREGHRFAGIRLDSGDLAYLSIEARRMLDEAGFPDAAIVASNELDETIIASLKDQGAAISIWGVGTRLATAFDQPALGGVYKLTAIRRPGEAWKYRLKLSEQAIKISTPGILQVRRYRIEGQLAGDMIFNEETAPSGETTMIDPLDITRRKTFASDTEHEDLLVPVFRKGQLVYDLPSLHDIRERSLMQVASLHPGVQRFIYPHRYPVGLEQHLHEMKTALVLEARERK